MATIVTSDAGDGMRVDARYRVWIHPGNDVRIDAGYYMRVDTGDR